MIIAFRMSNKEIEQFMAQRITRLAARPGELITSAEIERMVRKTNRFYSRRNNGRKRMTHRDRS